MPARRDSLSEQVVEGLQHDDINEFPNVKAWHDKLAQRPAFQKGLQVPVPYPFSNEAVSNPDGQEFYKIMRKNGTQLIKQATDSWKGEVPSVPSDYANYA